MPKPSHYETTHYPKTLIIAVHAPYNRTKNIDAYVNEFVSLAKTLGTPYETMLEIKLRTVDSVYFITTGKLSEIQETCEHLGIEQVIISESITAQQERNMSNFLHCDIIDRTQLILDIFEQSAHSAEGKIQVAIARMQHAKTRLAGKGKFLSQQTGHIGVRGGPGETAKERETRCIDSNIAKLKRKLDTLAKSRATQRKQRLNTQVPQICLIGYTNAGKSTILNTLTKSNVLAQDKLFATLDTTTRELYINHEKKGLLSDTVGFIQQLPTKLINAFKSTLSELQYADLLLHVIDISDQSWEQHIKVVHAILDDLGVDKPMLYVFNKVDNLGELIPDAVIHYKPHVLISAHDKKGITPLRDFLADWQKTGLPTPSLQSTSD